MLRSRLPITLLAVAAAMWLLAASPASAITNPAPDNGAHPYVGLVRFEIDGAPAGRCSGTLLSPTVFLTAGHCTVGRTVARVWLEEEVEGNPEYPAGGATSYEGLPYTIAGFCNPCGPSGPEFDYRDVGVVVLTEPVPDSVMSSYGQPPSRDWPTRCGAPPSTWSGTALRSGCGAEARRCGRGRGTGSRPMPTSFPVSSPPVRSC